MSEPIAKITQVEGQGMLTLRGDLSDAVVQKAAEAASGATVPMQGRIAVQDARALAWMSPDELLVLCPYADIAATLAALQGDLGGTHALAVDVSDARAVFAIAGPQAREVLAKLAPVDLRPERFGTGMFRRTRLAQVPAAFWLSAPDTFHLVCFRSVATYVHDLLHAAAQPGSAVEVF